MKWLIAVLVLGGAAFYVYKKRQPTIVNMGAIKLDRDSASKVRNDEGNTAQKIKKHNVLVENAPKVISIEEVKIGDIVGYFKSLHLNPQKEVPFVCDLNKFDASSWFPKLSLPQKSIVLLVGVYNEESESISNVQILCSEFIDDKMSEIISNEDLVVLS